MLISWSKVRFGSLQEKIKEVRDKLEVFYDLTLSAPPDEHRQNLQNELHELLIQEEAFWQQRSRIDVGCIPRVISQEMNIWVEREIEEEEVYRALKQMHPGKAPGPCGFSPMFYQQFWDIVGKDVVEAVKVFLESEESMRQVNNTWVTLIHKVKTPENMQQLRPISLCNVIYKICSKVLANRLKSLLDGIISPFQSVFVPGTLISDNSILAYEISH
ncbi:hypothetical protein ACLB2K_059505 [Fragaria x ananassa]